MREVANTGVHEDLLSLRLFRNEDGSRSLLVDVRTGEHSGLIKGHNHPVQHYYTQGYCRVGIEGDTLVTEIAGERFFAQSRAIRT